jgi:four helix bundle protein
MKENIIKTKSFRFACRIIDLAEFLDKKRKYVLSNQILKSGTSIGACVMESEHAESKADFVHKLSISLKEANETKYWLELIKYAKYIDDLKYTLIDSELTEILKLLTAIIKTSKQKR